MMRIVAGALALTLATPEAVARDLDFACDVERVVDGDTVRCAEMVAPLRLWGIDAPDKACRGRLNCRQDRRGAAEATKALRALVQGRRMQCEGVGVDRYGRVVARCRIWTIDVGCLMVRSGHAIDVPRYSGGYYRRCAP